MTIPEEFSRIIHARGSAYAAIAAKGGTVGDHVTIEDVADCITSIPTSGLNNGVGDDVIFIDYDGTEIAAFSAEEFRLLNSLPPNPSHAGLIAQGWNWTLEQINNQLTKVGGKVIVGQMYVTESGMTEIDITLTEDTKSPSLIFGVNGTVVIDWGDGSSDTDTYNNTGSTRNIAHEYANAGNYTIKINVTSGVGAFYNSSGYNTILSGNAYTYGNMAYGSKIKAVRIGNNWELRRNSFSRCSSLETVTMPNSAYAEWEGSIFEYCYALKAIVIPTGITYARGNMCWHCYSLGCISLPGTLTMFGGNVFRECYSLKYITVPYGVTQISGTSFYLCHSIQSIRLPDTITTFECTQMCDGCYALNEFVFPNGITKIYNKTFYNCGALKSVVIPNTVESIDSSAFYNCSSLESIVIPNSVKNIANDVFDLCIGLKSVVLPTNEEFYTIKGSLFLSCRSLSKLTIPSSVDGINGQAFKGCNSMKEYHFLRTSPPTLSATTAFDNIPSDCIIYVPYSSDHSILTAYQTATNWSTYASYMQEEPQ